MKKNFSRIISFVLSLALLAGFIPVTIHAQASINTPLVINEVVPDTDNVDGSDAYEFFEIQNTSNVKIDLNDYKIRYNISDIWSLDDSNLVLDPGQILTVWIKNAANQALTADDFNKYYSTSLISGSNLTTVQSNGFHNSKQRDLAIVTSTGQEISLIRYNHDDVKLVLKDMGINFAYNPDSSMETLISYDRKASPGVAEEEQKYSSEFNFTINDQGKVIAEATEKLAFNNSWEVKVSQDITNLVIDAKLLIKGKGQTEYKNMS